MIIEIDRTVTPQRVGVKGKDVSTDHYSFIINFKNPQLAGGWKKYKELMDDCTEVAQINDDENISSTEAFDRINKLQDKIR